MAEQAEKGGKPAAAPDKDRVSDTDLERVSGGVGGPEDRNPHAPDPSQPLRISRVPQS